MEQQFHRYDTVCISVRDKFGPREIRGLLLSMMYDGVIRDIPICSILTTQKYYTGIEYENDWQPKYDDRFESIMSRKILPARIVLIEKSVIGTPVKNWKDKLNPDYKEEDDEDFYNE